MLIGLVGASGAGKTSIANVLVNNDGFHRLHMGQPIKDMLSAFGLTETELHGSPEVRAKPSQRLAGKSPRFAMQTLGTDWGRELISKHIWADHLRRTIASLHHARVKNIIVDDLRFPEDFEAILAAGGMIVRVLRPALRDNPSKAERIARTIPSLRNQFRKLGLQVEHETEVYWRTAPAIFDVVNDKSVESASRDVLYGCAKLVDSHHSRN